MKVRGYITHKAAEKFSDCADYYRICPKTKRVAVSDGVSQSTMPLEWAKILVDAYVNGEWIPGDDLSSLKSKWLNDAQSFLKEQKEQGIINWMLENNLLEHDGAGATFCGLDFYEQNKWSASILGDTCLVIINEDKHIEEVIASREGDFDNRPDYFDSFGQQRGKILKKEGVLDESHFLLLVSDPLSELFQKIKNTEKESVIISKLLDLKSFEEFLIYVDELRGNYGMHNDDTTIVFIEYDGTDIFNVNENEKTLDILINEEKKKDEEVRIEVENRIAKLDEDGWLKAEMANSIKGYGEYLSSHPDGKYCSMAIEKLNELDKKRPQKKKPEGKDEMESEPSSEDPVCCNSGKNNQETDKGAIGDDVQEVAQTVQAIEEQSKCPKNSSEREIVH